MVKSYVSEFLSLRCAGDILNVLNPITRCEKEISEAMSIITRLRSIAIKKPMHYTLIDMCAGNGLVSATAIHLLPFKEAIAYDKAPRHRKWEAIRRFSYIKKDINDIDYLPTDIPSVMVASHPCRNLALKIIQIYQKSPSCKALIMLPCCVGEIENDFFRSVPSAILRKTNKYEKWCWFLSEKTQGKLTFDEKCLSPCNGLIEAKINEQ